MSEARVNETKPDPSPSTINSTGVSWTSTQAYALAAFCLLLGVALGYLFRGSASPTTTQAAAATTGQPAGTQQGQAQQDQPDPNLQAALTQAAAPLLEAVNQDPKDFDSLVKLGNLYYDGKQFPSAIQYYERALAIHPENPDVRTDMGTAYW